MTTATPKLRYSVPRYNSPLKAEHFLHLCNAASLSAGSTAEDWLLVSWANVNTKYIYARRRKYISATSFAKWILKIYRTFFTHWQKVTYKINCCAQDLCFTGLSLCVSYWWRGKEADLSKITSSNFSVTYNLYSQCRLLFLFSQTLLLQCPFLHR